MRRFTFAVYALLAALWLAAAVPAAAAEHHGIARIWKGRTLAEKADAYEKYLGETGIPMILKTPGNLGAQMLRRDDGREVEFVVISFWDSIEAIKRFAGPDYQKAVILERDREFLVAVEPNVLHYEIVKLEPKK
jgi:heme-degrading monooxygenase HmoA